MLPIIDFVNTPHRELRNDSLDKQQLLRSEQHAKVGHKMKTQQMPELMRTLQQIFGKRDDLKYAICSQANYVLCEAAHRFEIDHRKWADMMQDEHAAEFWRLLRFKDRNTHIAKSSDACLYYCPFPLVANAG